MILAMVRPRDLGVAERLNRARIRCVSCRAKKSLSDLTTKATWDRSGSFADDFLRGFVLPQSCESGESQMPVGRPFGELDLSNELGPNPYAFFHFFFRQRPRRAFFLR